MNFAVVFENKRGRLHVARVEPVQHIGTDILDRIRQEHPGVSLADVDGEIRALHVKSMALQLTEAMARATGLFRETGKITVTVSNDDDDETKRPFDRFVKRHVCSQEPRVEHVLHESDVLEAWEAGGFPLDWNIDAEEVYTYLGEEILAKLRPAEESWQDAMLRRATKHACRLSYPDLGVLEELLRELPDDIDKVKCHAGIEGLIEANQSWVKEHFGPDDWFVPPAWRHYLQW